MHIHTARSNTARSNTTPIKTAHIAPSLRLVASLPALLGLALSLTLGLARMTPSPASAQTPPATLSLTPSITTAQVGQTVTFSVVLNGGSDIGAYDFNLLLGSANLSYVGGFTFNAGAGFTSFPASFASGGTMEVSAGYPLNTSAGPQVNTALGTFSVLYTGVVGAPVTTPITFGTPGVGDGESAVYKLTGGSNELTGVTGASLVTTSLSSAPEPSALLTMGMGAMLLGGARWRTRRSHKRNKQSALTSNPLWNL